MQGISSPQVPLPDKNKLKVQLSGFYGRIGESRNLAICTDNEGYKIPSEWMRRLLEPEYYSFHRAAYPFIQFKVCIPNDDDGSDGSDSNITTFVAVAHSHCFEEFLLDDEEFNPSEEIKSNAIANDIHLFRWASGLPAILNGAEIERQFLAKVEELSAEQQIAEKKELLFKLMELMKNEKVKLSQEFTVDSLLLDMKKEYIRLNVGKNIQQLALRFFRVTIHAESEFKLSVFAKTQRESNHLGILTKLLSKLTEFKLMELMETEKVKRSKEFTVDSPLLDLKKEYIRLKVEKDIRHLDDDIRKKQETFSYCVAMLLGCLDALAGRKVVHKNLFNLKLLEIFKFFLKADSLVLMVCICIRQLFAVVSLLIAGSS
jgi:hypothetical protein